MTWTRFSLRPSTRRSAKGCRDARRQSGRATPRRRPTAGTLRRDRRCPQPRRRAPGGTATPTREGRQPRGRPMVPIGGTDEQPFAWTPLFSLRQELSAIAKAVPRTRRANVPAISIGKSWRVVLARAAPRSFADEPCVGEATAYHAKNPPSAEVGCTIQNQPAAQKSHPSVARIRHKGVGRTTP